MKTDLESLMRDLGLRIYGAVGVVGLIVSIACIGDQLDIKLMNSGGSLLIATIISGEALLI